jgi:VWFA-related protein
MVSGFGDSDLTLARDDLRVVEGSVEQAVDTFYEATSPVSIAMLVDESGSMKSAVEQAKAAAKAFVGALRPEDSLGIIRFSDQALLAQDFSRNRSASLTALDEYQAHGGTALYDALHRAIARLTQVDGRRVIVLFTDGRDENNAGTGPGSEVTLAEVTDELRDSGALVFAIGLGAKVDRGVLEHFAADSGGEAYFPETVDSLGDNYARIVENLRRRYTISYTSTNSTRDGKWRDVQIAVPGQHLRIVQRGGYYAPDR